MTGKERLAELDAELRSGELSRAVNERIRELDGHPGLADDVFVCECVDAQCFISLPLPAEEFDTARASVGSYVVAPGHERAGLDEVLERHDHYTVVLRSAG